MLEIAKNTMKAKCYVLSNYKQRKNVWLLYLEFKLQQDRYSYCNSKLKCYQGVEGIYLETSKQEGKYRHVFGC